MTQAWLTELEETLAADEEGEALPIAVVVLASMAGRRVPIQEDEAHGAARRALLLLAAGGDPARGLDLNGRAVEALAEDLDATDRRSALTEGLVALRSETASLPHLNEALHALLETPDVAWRAYACSLLAEALDESE
jgi:hypothetical protein